jgi:hypothetical protein
VPVSKRATVRPLAGRQADGAAGGKGARNCEGLGIVVIPTRHVGPTPHGDCSEDKVPSCIDVDNSHFILVNTTLFPADGAAV